MQPVKHIICVILVLAVGMAVMPGHKYNDKDNDGLVGLADTIIVTRYLQNSTDSPYSLKQNLQEAINSFQIVAGLKLSYQSLDDLGCASHWLMIFLVTIFCYLLFQLSTFRNNIVFCNLVSFSVEPEIPPPKMVHLH